MKESAEPHRRGAEKAILRPRKKASRHIIKYDTDVTAKKIWLSLLRDFRTYEGNEYCKNAETAFLKGVTNFRDYTFPEIGIVAPSRFKHSMQLANLFKKYRFAKDKYTDEELEEKTHQAFADEQEFFAALKPQTMLRQRVLQRARTIARRILGKYNPQHTVVASRFGKKSSIGCPLSLAYIDHKLVDAKAFTGSTECSRWFFDEVVPNDPILQELIKNMGLTMSLDANLLHDSLNLVNVPKTWKKYRPITPLTLLGLFYSYGVGDQVTKCLEAEGLDIRRLQAKHRDLIRQFSCDDDQPTSVDGPESHATVDLSSASQSLLCDLLNQVLPREWYVAMKKTFSHQLVTRRGKETVQMYTESVLPMGNGLTFPVETLVFYVITKAIAELSKTRGIISVYGDDLIYPSRLHKYTTVIFPQLKLNINLDKTFVKAPFRESCGSDFYRGADVRPFFLPGEGQLLTRTRYAVWLYKVYNGLCRRWDSEEIKSTLYLLLTELAMTGLKLHRVPPCYPDTAGIRVSNPGVIPQNAGILDWSPVNIRVQRGSQWYSFRFLTELPSRRVVKSVLPYYWLALQSLDDSLSELDYSGEQPLQHVLGSYNSWPPKPIDLESNSLEVDNFWDTDYSVLYDCHSTSPLEWGKLKRVRSYKMKNGKQKKVVRYKQFATCAVKTHTHVEEVKSSSPDVPDQISDWI